MIRVPERNLSTRLRVCPTAQIPSPYSERCIVVNSGGESYSRDFSRFLPFSLLNARMRAGVGFL